jgi:hypothetical protein
MKPSNIANIVLVGVVVYLLMKPKPVENPYYLREMKKSIKRQDSLVNLINELQTVKYELKDTINSIDSIYTDLSKDSLRARIRHNLSTRFRR